VTAARQIELNGRVALVTGGSRGIGFGVAERLLDAGAAVALAGRTLTDLDRARTRLGSDQVSVHRCDVSDPLAVESLVERVVAHHGQLDILVCSHGAYPGTRSILNITVDEFDQTMSVNVRGVFLCAQASAREMLRHDGGGRIVLISSMNAVLSQYGAADYDASKAALHGLTRAMAIELAPHDITVNAIAPGWVRTEMSAAELAHLSDKVLNPTQRVGEPSDIARAAVWLADPDNSYVTGSVVRVDGGQTAMLPQPWDP
jgi:NAD(P)-dependent dehydrogenase (short-subunit alcohol dehydrogenase family)